MSLIKLTKKDLKVCVDFAEECAPTNNYGSRGQSNMEKRKQDISGGKKAEIAVHRFLTSKGYKVPDVDFNIYKGRQKRHGEDLNIEGVKVEIKSQTLDSVRKYGLSWLYESKADEALVDHILIMTLLISENEVLILNAKPFDLVPKGKPKLAYLKTKSAIYYDDIIVDNLKAIIE